MTTDVIKILAMDDDPTRLQELKAVLRQILPEAMVLGATTGEDGLVLARAEAPDVILLDTVMLEREDYALYDALRAEERLREIPVCLLIAPRSESKGRGRALAAGAEGFLVRPLDGEELTAQIRALARSGVTGRAQRLEREQAAGRMKVLRRELDEQKQVEVALRESMAKLDGIYRAAPVGIGMVVARVFVEVNDTLCRMTGYSREELLGRSARMIYPSDEDYEYVGREKYRQILERGAGSVETRWQRKDGQVMEILLSSAALDPADLTQGVVFTALDITGRKRAEEALLIRARQQETIARLGQLALAGADLSALLDRAVHDVAETLDVELCKVLELLPDRSAFLLRAGVGWQPGLVGSDTVSNDLNSQAGYTLHSREPVVVADLRRETRFHGPPLLHDHHVVSGVSVIIGAVEQPYGVLGVHSTRPREFTQQDVHFLQSVANLLADAIERKRSEERLRATLAELQRANADLERFAYAASHDLQEPLRMVASYAQLLGIRYQGKLDAEADEFIGYMVEGAERLQQLILDILTYWSVGLHGRPFAPTDASAVCRAVLRDLEAEIAESGAVVECAVLPTVLADATQLHQVLRHLIGNAIKFRGEAPPHVRISAHEAVEPRPSLSGPTRFWRFAVQDNGIGIEPCYFDRIFALFQRLHTRQKYAGSGIGLPLCKRIVERHGGRIWVESTPGQGSAFYFTWPGVPASDGGVR